VTAIDIATATPSLRLHPIALGQFERIVPRENARRMLNVAVAAIGLVATAPLMALIAVAVKLESPGPAFYRQRRVGIDRRTTYGGNSRRVTDMGGRPFMIYKFRTMAAAKSDSESERWAAPNDPRVTRLGRVLRKYRLDELPQLYNVLMGDMNVVGPRPEQPAIFATLREQVYGYAARQRVRPGITGWAQVNQHYDTCVEDVKRKVTYDLEYVARQSLTEDLRIMLRTVPTVAFRRGAW
jgi:lipopolysaccharide/colanic/teichoic acid biosynthesis glycosyltransferase